MQSYLSSISISSAGVAEAAAERKTSCLPLSVILVYLAMASAYDAAGLCSQENGIQPAPCSHAETFSASVDSHLMTSYSRTTWVSQLSTRKVKPIRILMRLEMMGSSILSWTICKSFTPHSKHPCQHLITVFTGRMLFLMPNQRCQSAEKNG